MSFAIARYDHLLLLTDSFRPKRSLNVPQAGRPIPSAKLKNMAVAVLATALALICDIRQSSELPLGKASSGRWLSAVHLHSR